MTINFAALNTATKYPSIETYHKLTDGRLTEERNFTFDGAVTLREKIDGTCTRVVKLLGGDYVIGAREHLLHARGDRIINPTEGIAEHLAPFADAWPALDDDAYLHVLYLETYGGKIGPAAKQYTGSGAVGHRLFDVAFIPRDVLEWPLAQISAWRKGGGQKFADEPTLMRAAQYHGLLLAPALGTVPAESLPTTRAGMYEWLRAVDQTFVALDDSGKGASEGAVLRTHDRSVIAKARIADYRKVLGDIPQPEELKKEERTHD